VQTDLLDLTKNNERKSARCENKNYSNRTVATALVCV